MARRIGEGTGAWSKVAMNPPQALLAVLTRKSLGISGGAPGVADSDTRNTYAYLKGVHFNISFPVLPVLIFWLISLFLGRSTKKQAAPYPFRIYCQLYGASFGEGGAGFVIRHGRERMSSISRVWQGFVPLGDLSWAARYSSAKKAPTRLFVEPYPIYQDFCTDIQARLVRCKIWMHKTPAPDTVPRFTQLSLLQVPAAKIGERELVVEHFNMTDNTADRKRTEHKAREQAHAKYATKAHHF